MKLKIRVKRWSEWKEDPVACSGSEGNCEGLGLEGDSEGWQEGRLAVDTEDFEVKTNQ